MPIARPLATLLRTALAVAALAPGAARAHIAELQAVLDTQQSVPPPVGTTTASGTGSFFLEEDGTVDADVTFQGLTGPAILAHIHEGAPGVANPAPLVDFTSLIIGGETGSIAGLGTVIGAATLSAAQQQTLLAGGMYFNIHTARNPGGEIRGQITIKPGTCSCTDATSPAVFKRCVKQALRGVDREERKEESVKALRKQVATSACGKAKAPKKTAACCLPFNPAQNIVTDRMCAAVKPAQCARLGGTSLGAGIPCAPNPCRVGSPSGAFID
jgi:hypothetical protein